MKTLPPRKCMLLFLLSFLLCRNVSAMRLIGEVQVSKDWDLTYAESVVHKNHLYITGMTGLHVLNLDNHLKPEYLMTIPHTSGAFSDVAGYGDFLLVLGYSQGIVALDVTDPLSMVPVDTLPLEGRARSMSLQGNFAYVTSSTRGVLIVDISDIRSMKVVGSVSGMGPASHIETRGSYTYATSNADQLAMDTIGNLHIIDISDPLSARTVSQVPIACDPGSGYYPTDLALWGNYAIVPSGYLNIVDISDPLNPVNVSPMDFRKATGMYAHKVLVQNEYCYVTDCWYAALLDMQPLNSSKAPSYVNCCSGLVLAIHQGYAYAFSNDSKGRLLIYDRIGEQGIVSTHDGPSAFDIFLLGFYVYVAAGDSGMHIIDVSRPRAPSFTGRCRIGNKVERICTKGDYTFTASVDGGICVLNTRTKNSPNVASRHNLTSRPRDMVCRENHLFIAADLRMSSGWELNVLDIEHPYMPSLVKRFEKQTSVSISVTAMFLDGKRAYITAGTESGGTLTIMDVSDIANIQILGSLEFAGAAPQDVAVEGTLAYVTLDHDYVCEVDVSRPDKPVRAASSSFKGGGRKLCLRKGTMYTTGTTRYSRAGGLMMFPASDLDNITEYAEVNTPFDVQSISVNDSHVYLGNAQGDIHIVDISGNAVGVWENTPRARRGQPSRGTVIGTRGNAGVSFVVNDAGTDHREARMRIYSVSGRKVAELSPRRQPGEGIEFLWNTGNQADGDGLVSNGRYIYSISDQTGLHATGVVPGSF